MSHFTVLMIGNDHEAQLAPFQENNMGNCPKQYMEFNSMEAELREQYDTDTKTMVLLADGTRVEETLEMFFRPATPEEIELITARKFEGRVSRRAGDDYRVWELPEGAQKIKVPFKELMTFDEYASDYSGYRMDEERGEYGYWENPHRKWDWYQIGGRWSGFFKLKDGAEGELGRRSLLDDSEDTRKAERRADQARKCDIDFEAMRNEAGEDAGQRWDMVQEVCGAHIDTFIPWAKMRELHAGNIDAAREAYHQQEAKKALWEASRDLDRDDPKRALAWLDLEEYQCSREAFVQRARDGACSTFAVLKDGEWYERGEMGWWGMVADEKEASEWNAQFAKLIDGLPEDTLLTVIDAHI